MASSSSSAPNPNPNPTQPPPPVQTPASTGTGPAGTNPAVFSGLSSLSALGKVPIQGNYPLNVHSYNVEALTLSLAPSAVFWKTLTDELPFWASFGRKDSMILRHTLWSLMTSRGLDNTEQFMVYFICTFMKRRDRILQGLARAPTSMKSASWFRKVSAFFMHHTVNFPDEEDEDHFAAIHINNTNPGLVLMIYMAFIPKTHRKIEDFLARQEAAQIHLDDTLLQEVRKQQEEFWNKKVTRTTHKTNEADFLRRRNATKKVLAPNSTASNPNWVDVPVGMFDEEIWKNQSGDEYLLIGFDGKEVDPKNTLTGYTSQEVKDWFNSLV